MLRDARRKTSVSYVRGSDLEEDEVEWVIASLLRDDSLVLVDTTVVVETRAAG